jgi:hypothetical protein
VVAVIPAVPEASGGLVPLSVFFHPPTGGQGGLSCDAGTNQQVGVATAAGDGIVTITPEPTLKTDPLSYTAPKGTTINIPLSALIGNVQDPNAGATISIASIGQSNTMGFAYYDAADQLLTYTADGFQPSATQPQDSFTYTAQDQFGGQVTGTVDVNVTGANEPTQVGTSGADTLTATKSNTR